MDYRSKDFLWARGKAGKAVVYIVQIWLAKGGGVKKYVILGGGIGGKRS